MIMGNVIATKSMATIIDVCNKIQEHNKVTVIIMLGTDVIIRIKIRVEMYIDLEITKKNLVQKHLESKLTLTTIKVVTIKMRQDGRCLKIVNKNEHSISIQKRMSSSSVVLQKRRKNKF
jgi:hypothetical protein